MSIFFGEIRQVGYVVRDIERAMADWATKLGVGPWFYKEDVGITEFSYYGRNSPPPALSIAVANSGGTQVELIQQRDDQPSLYRDTLERNGEIAQHVAYWTVDRFDEWCDKLKVSGFTEGHAGRIGDRGRFAYYVRPDFPSCMIELSESLGGKAEYFEKVRQASVGWDGKDPIRLPSSLS